MFKVISVMASLLVTYAVMTILVKIFASAIAIAVGTPIGAIAMVAALYAIYRNERRKRIRFEKRSKGLWD